MKNNTNGHAKKRRTLDDTLAIAQKRVAILEAREKIRQYQIVRTRQKKLLESAEAWEFLGPYSDIVDRAGGIDRDLVFPFSTANDRRYGANWPFWRTWQEHSRLRAASRLLWTMSPLAFGAINALASYVVGKGFQVKVQAKRPDTPRELIQAIQTDVFTPFEKHNNWLVRQRRLFVRRRRDGEVFVRLFGQDDGMLLVRTVEPEQIVESPDYPYDQGSFGIITDPDDLEDVRGYWVAYDGSASNGEYVSNGDMIHLKTGNVDEEVIKRGLPDFAFDTQKLYKVTGRLLQNLGEGSAVQAAIAFIRQHSTAPRAAAADFISGMADYTQDRPFSSATDNVRRYDAGTVIDMDLGTEFVSAPFAENVSGFTAAVQALLRAVAVRWNAPEWITSADASNGSYACHDSETELLTRRGWLRWNEIRMDDLAGTMNPETGVFEWQQMQAVHVQDHDGDMIQLKGLHNLDVLVTPNHRMWYTTKQNRRRDGKMVREGLKPWRFCRADELQPGSILPFSCKPTAGIARECLEIPGVPHDRKYSSAASHPQSKTFPMGPFLEWLGWWVSEGWAVANPHWPGGHILAWSQASKHVEECEAIRHCNSTVQLAYSVREQANRNGVISWHIADKSLWSWLRKNCGKNSRERSLPDFVNDLPAEQIEPMIQSLVAGDGSLRESGSMQYFTTSRRLVDQMQATAIRCGYVSHVQNANDRGVVPVSLKLPKRNLLVSKRHISTVPYSGKVWCVTVPNGLIVTRRNGKSIITGNSSLTAESPFTRSCQSMQSEDLQMHERVYTTALEHYCRRKGGVRVGDKLYEWKLIQHLVETQVTAPSVETRNKQEEAAVNQIYVTLGVKSRQTVVQELGLDWEVEEKNNEEFEKKHGEQGVPTEQRTDEDSGGDPDEGGDSPSAPDDAPDGGSSPDGGDDLEDFDLDAFLDGLDLDESGESSTMEGDCVPNKGSKGHHDSEKGYPCTPSGSAEQSSAKSGKKNTGKSAGRVAAIENLVQSLGDKAVTVKDAVRKVGKFVWEGASERERKGIVTVLNLAKAVEHALTPHFRKAQSIVAEIGRAKGYSEEVVRRTAAAVASADNALAWTLTGPAVLLATGSAGAAKAASFLPVASLGYLAFSTAKNPLLTLRSARKAMAEKVQAVHEAVEISRDAIADLLASMASAKDPDAYLARVLAALDYTGYDLAKAVKLAGDDEAKVTGVAEALTESPRYLRECPECGMGPLVEAGHTGRTTDKNGHVHCYVNGKHVSCKSAQHSGGFSDKDVQAAHEHVRKLTAAPHAVTPKDITSAAHALKFLTKAELNDLKKEYGLRAGGKKEVMVERIVTAAKRSLRLGQQWERRARIAGIDHRAMKDRAREIRTASASYVNDAGKAIKETRALYKALTGKALTSRHPAFESGDHTSLEKFALVARTIAGRYPHLLGNPDDDGARQNLFDLLVSGSPALPSRAKAYQQAFDALVAAKTDEAGDEVPFEIDDLLGADDGTSDGTENGANGEASPAGKTGVEDPAEVGKTVPARGDDVEPGVAGGGDEVPAATAAGVGGPDAGDVLPGRGETVEPGFTGIDSLGRHWVDGEMVAKAEETGAGKPSRGEEPPAPATQTSKDEEPTDARPTRSDPVSEPVRRGNNDRVAGGDDRGVGREFTRPRIVTARPEHTQRGDPGLVPETVRGHLNEDQVQGAALAIAAIEKHGGFVLADSTGVGKTRQQLATAQAFLDKGKKVVIVSPAEVIKPDWKKGQMAGSYAHDAATMKVPVKLVKGDVPVEPGTVNVTTYNELGKLKDKIDKDTILIYDESHFMKNRDSARYKHGKEAMERAGGVMYATATPGDKPLHIAHLMRAGVFGNVGATETYKKLGMRLVDQHTGGGNYVKVWQIDPRVGYQEAARRLSGLFDQMTKDGLMVKRELSMDGVDVGMSRVELSQEEHDAIQNVYDRKMSETGGNKAVSLMAARLHQEPMKIPHTVGVVQEELSQGRSVVVFAGRVNDIGDETEDGEDDDKDMRSAGTAKALKDALIQAGIPADSIGELHGGATKTADAKKNAMNAFQSGKTRVMIATIQSGGTGINLDDTTGERPRTMVMMTPPFTANDMVQAAGRIHRLNTASAARVRGVLSDTAIDDWNAGILENKFRTLGAIVGGESKRSQAAIRPEDAPDAASGTDAFDWGETLKTQPKHYANTPYSHNDVIGQFGGKRTQVNGQWTTAFPSEEAYKKYQAHVAPKPAAPAAPAAPAVPMGAERKTDKAVPSVSDTKPFTIATKKVSTSRGERHVHSFTPTEAFWSARKAGKLPDNVTVRKNDRTGQWEASIWGADPEEVQATAGKLELQGVTRFSR